MNHPLNPNAAEFVPVTSPVKSPVCKMPWETDNGHHDELKHEIENGFDKKSLDIHAGNKGVDLHDNDSNGHGLDVDIHAFDKTHGLDVHNNGDGIDVHHNVENSHGIDILGSVDVKNHKGFDEDENDEIIACSPKKPKTVNIVGDEDDFLDDIKKRPSSGFQPNENGDHDSDHDDMNGFESLDVSKAQATLGDSTINYMADLSTTMASPHHGNLLSEDYTTSSLSPSSPHGAADSQASNPFDNPFSSDKNETHDFDKHSNFDEKHNDFSNDENVEKTIENNEHNGFSSDFTGANLTTALETSAKVDETLIIGDESVDQDHNLEDIQAKHSEVIESHSENAEHEEVGASKKDAFEDHFEKEDELDVKPSAPLDPADADADSVKDNSAADLTDFEIEKSHQEEVDNLSHNPQQQVVEEDVPDLTTESAAAKFDANTFNEFHTANDNSGFFAKDQTLSDDVPLSLASQTPLNCAEETLQNMLDLVQTPNERRVSSDVLEAYNAVFHSLDTPAGSKNAELDFNFEMPAKKEAQFEQQEESAECELKQEPVDDSHVEQKEELGYNDDKKDMEFENIKQEHDDAVNGSYVEESHLETQQSRELESVEETQENDQFASQLESEQQAGSEQTGENVEVKVEAELDEEKDLHQTLQTEEFEFHREDNATNASTLDETTDDFNSFIEKQEREGNVETFTMEAITPADFLAKHDAFVEKHVTEEENINEIVKDTNMESGETLTNVETNINEAVTNVSEPIQEEEEEEEIQIGKKVSNLNESDVMSQSFYGNYDEEPARSPSPEEMIDHYEKAQQQEKLLQEQLAADEAAKELTPTMETTTLEAKLAQDDDEHLAETTSDETKQPEQEHQEKVTGGQLFEISTEETSFNKSQQDQFDDLTFESKTSESSLQQRAEEVVEQSSVTTLETNLDDFTSQETKIESEFLENTKDAEAKEEVSGPTSVPDVVPTPGNEDSQTSTVDLTQDIVEEKESTLPAGDVIAEDVEAASQVTDKQEISAIGSVANETVEEKEDTSSTVTKAVAAVGAAAAVGVAAAVAAKKTTTAAKKPLAASATKKLDVKSPLSKPSTGAKPLAKTTTTAMKPAVKTATTTTAAKKPVTTAAKSTLAAKPAPKPAAPKPAAPKPSTTTAAKPAPIRKPVASTVTKTTTTGVSAAPKPAAAKPASKPAVSAAPKPKPATTTATKPLTNGVAKRPATATSTAASRTSSSAASKPAAPRVPLSQRTSTTAKPSTTSSSTTSSTVKKTSTTSTAPARKPLSSVTSKVGSNATSKVGSNMKPKVGAAGTALKSSSNAIKKTEIKTSSTTAKSVVTKPAEKTETPAVTESAASPVMTNGH
ncbi:hypothetical protein WDU94_006250 [Cyamophila willieti]